MTLRVLCVGGPPFTAGCVSPTMNGGPPAEEMTLLVRQMWTSAVHLQCVVYVLVHHVDTEAVLVGQDPCDPAIYISSSRQVPMNLTYRKFTVHSRPHPERSLQRHPEHSPHRHPEHFPHRHPEHFPHRHPERSRRVAYFVGGYWILALASMTTIAKMDSRLRGNDSGGPLRCGGRVFRLGHKRSRLCLPARSEDHAGTTTRATVGCLKLVWDGHEI